MNEQEKEKNICALFDDEHHRKGTGQYFCRNIMRILKFILYCCFVICIHLKILFSSVLVLVVTYYIILVYNTTNLCCVLHRGLQKLFLPMLVALFERDPRRVWSFERLFSSVLVLVVTYGSV